MSERDQWLAERRKGIGATDAAKIAGVSPWGSILDVYLDKTGVVVENNPSLKMRLGLMVEPIVAQLYADETGRTLVKPPKLEVNPDCPWQICSRDYQVQGEARNVETKTVDPMHLAEWGPAGTDQIPDVYMVQVQHQMLVSRIPVTDLAALVGLRELRIYTIEFNADLAEMLTAMQAEFWARVQSGQPPPPDWSDPRTAQLIQAMNRPKGGSVALSQEHLELVERYEDLGDEITFAEIERENIKARLAQTMGEAVEGVLPDGRIVSRKLGDRAGYTVKPKAGIVTFRILNARKTKVTA